MANRESFLIRVDSDLLEAVRFAARDEMRSVNRQIEFLIRRALHESGWPGNSQRQRSVRTKKSSSAYPEGNSTPRHSTDNNPEEKDIVEA